MTTHIPSYDSPWDAPTFADEPVEPAPDPWEEQLTAQDFQDMFANYDEPSRFDALPPIPTSLNESQRAAVEALAGRVMVVAGPGSGKTKTLTERIANLIRTGVSPSTILAISFTRKAAAEVRERLATVVGSDRAAQVWVMTFHGFASRLIRAEGDLVGVPAAFETMDSADQAKLLRAVAREFNLEVPKDALSRISVAKRAAASSMQARINEMKIHDPEMANLWLGYENAKKKLHRLDYDDLIVLAHQLLQDDEVRARWSSRFRHVSVDEYQDTDELQHELITRLAEVGDSLFIVGDVDQSIYAFRGATPAIMASFAEQFPDTNVIVLHDNYRSTPQILDAARAVIEPIEVPFRSALRANNSQAGPVQVRTFFTSRDEVAATVTRIKMLLENGADPQEIAVLYRAKAQARDFERELKRAKLPYVLSGGDSFYSRAEIKDALAWLRCAVSPTDQMAFERAVGQVQGLGPKAISAAVTGAEDAYSGDHFKWACDYVTNMTAMKKGSQKGVQAWAAFVAGIRAIRSALNSAGLQEAVLQATTLVPVEGDADQRVARADNLQRLIEDAAEFTPEAPVQSTSGNLVTHPFYGDGIMGEYTQEMATVRVEFMDADENGDTEHEFLTSSVPHLFTYTGARAITPVLEFLQTLSIDKKELDETPTPGVQLSTMHAAKGREFDHVIVVGCEDGVLPSMYSSSPRTNSAGSELRNAPRVGDHEERRLMFVAVSRARQTLVISWAKSRMLQGRRMFNMASEYLYDLQAADAAKFDQKLPAWSAKSSDW